VTIKGEISSAGLRCGVGRTPGCSAAAGGGVSCRQPSGAEGEAGSLGGIAEPSGAGGLDSVRGFLLSWMPADEAIWHDIACLPCLRQGTFLQEDREISCRECVLYLRF